MADTSKLRAQSALAGLAAHLAPKNLARLGHVSSFFRQHRMKMPYRIRDGASISDEHMMPPTTSNVSDPSVQNAEFENPFDYHDALWLYRQLTVHKESERHLPACLEYVGCFYFFEKLQLQLLNHDVLRLVSSQTKEVRMTNEGQQPPTLTLGETLPFFSGLHTLQLDLSFFKDARKWVTEVAKWMVKNDVFLRELSISLHFFTHNNRSLAPLLAKECRFRWQELVLAAKPVDSFTPLVRDHVQHMLRKELDPKEILFNRNDYRCAIHRSECESLQPNGHTPHCTRESEGKCMQFVHILHSPS